MAKTAHLAGVSASRVAAVAAVLLAVLVGAGCSTSGLDAPAAAGGTGFVEDALFADRDKALQDMSAVERPDVDAIETSAIEPAAGYGAMGGSALGTAGVFGSVAIPIRNFPVSARWARVEREIHECVAASACGGEGSLLDRIATDTEGKPLAEKLQIVNAAVNSAVLYRSDLSLYGKPDYWAGPGETLSHASGDCEDFAILKMTALIKAGVPAHALSLVVLRDNHHGAFHAVLAVASPSGSFILDNNNSSVVMDAGIPWYQPLYSFREEQAWIHGTRAARSPALALDGDLSSIAPGAGLVADTEGRSAGQ